MTKIPDHRKAKRVTSIFSGLLAVVGLAATHQTRADDTLVYKGTISLKGQIVSQLEGQTDSETLKKLRGKLNLFFIVEKGGTEKAVILVSRNKKDKIYAVDKNPLAMEALEFLGLNGKSEQKLSRQFYASGNFSAEGDRDMDTVTDTYLTKSGSMQGRQRHVTINDEMSFIPKSLKGKYYTTQTSSVANANPDPESPPSYVDGQDLTSIVEALGLKLDTKRTANYNGDTTSDTADGITFDLDNQGFSSVEQFQMNFLIAALLAAWSAAD